MKCVLELSEESLQRNIKRVVEFSEASLQLLERYCPTPPHPRSHPTKENMSVA